MPEPSYVVSPEALDDLDAIHAYISKHNECEVKTKARNERGKEGAGGALKGFIFDGLSKKADSAKPRRRKCFLWVSLQTSINIPELPKAGKKSLLSDYLLKTIS